MYDKKDLLEMLTVTGSAQDELFKEARKLREDSFGNQVIVRGVTEVTNLCRVNCDYCPMRRDNTRTNSTFILSEDQILQAVEYIKEYGIKVVFFQAGEVPQTTKIIGEVIPKIKEMFDGDIEVLLNLGNKPREEYAYLKEQGADSYIIKHETSDPVLHEKLRYETLEYRLQYLKTLLELGYKVGTGTIVGLPGQNLESIADDILLAVELGVHMSSVAPFIPAPRTPLENHPYGSVNTALNAIAAMRLVSPSWYIPTVSALEKIEKGGQLRGLEAGANVLTINFTPNTERQKYLIYGQERYVVRTNHVAEMLDQAGLQPSLFPNPQRTLHETPALTS